MPIDASILVITDEGGEVTRYPVRKSALLQFERKYLRPFNDQSPLDQAIISFRTSHGRWPADDGHQHELDSWVDSVQIDTEPAEASENGTDPTEAPAPGS